MLIKVLKYTSVRVPSNFGGRAYRYECTVEAYTANDLRDAREGIKGLFYGYINGVENVIACQLSVLDATVDYDNGIRYYITAEIGVDS